MKKHFMITFIILAVSIFLSTSSFAESTWTPARGLENNMIVYGKLLVNGTMVQSSDYVIAAFDDLDVCKGKAALKMHDKAINYYLTISSNKNAEKIYFKVLDTKTGTEYKIMDVITFQSDSTIADKVLNAF